jgi:hypothetical protein
MSRGNLFYHHEQIASCVRPALNVTPFMVSRFALFNMRIQERFLHFVNCHTVLDPDFFFDCKGNLQLIEVHTNIPSWVILVHGCGQSR